ncbi:hypothetical protein FRC09_011621 [Ceratobasidium sp. 395]|nr:hypothetical protein FRC09_011621 [Ceratobasidium sp. 395]
MNPAHEEAIPFDSRVGVWIFHPPTVVMAYAGQVARWAQMSRFHLYFEFAMIGQEHLPCWIARPFVNEEGLGSQYFGYGTNKQLAKEAACRKMASSGHC